MQLVTPTASFVAKTANSKSGQKIFINVCTSDKVLNHACFLKMQTENLQMYNAAFVYCVTQTSSMPVMI